MPIVRPPAVAGVFYPEQPILLRELIAQQLAANRHESSRPKALIVPHAGYAYSAPIAASAYSTLRPYADSIRHVTLLGPAHRAALHDLALPGASAFATPLGDIPVDQDGITALRSLGIGDNAASHALEHSLEVQLPFLQCTLHDFTILPVLAGHCTPERAAEILEQVWGRDDTLIIISSDLSHYEDYATASSLDQATLQQIVAGRLPLQTSQACGAIPVAGLMQCAGRHRLAARLLDYRNSGDTSGNRQQVVGYAAIAFSEDSHDVVH